MGWDWMDPTQNSSPARAPSGANNPAHFYYVNTALSLVDSKALLIGSVVFHSDLSNDPIIFRINLYLSMSCFRHCCISSSLPVTAFSMLQRHSPTILSTFCKLWANLHFSSYLAKVHLKFYSKTLRAVQKKALCSTDGNPSKCFEFLLRNKQFVV